MSQKIGILLINLGTPDGSDPRSVKRYLKEFLSDPRIIDLPKMARWLLVNLFILPFRTKKSAAAYQKIWRAEGSPLLLNSIAIQETLANRLKGRGMGVNKLISLNPLNQILGQQPIHQPSNLHQPRMAHQSQHHMVPQSNYQQNSTNIRDEWDPYFDEEKDIQIDPDELDELDELDEQSLLDEDDLQEDNGFLGEEPLLDLDENDLDEDDLMNLNK